MNVPSAAQVPMQTASIPHQVYALQAARNIPSSYPAPPPSTSAQDLEEVEVENNSEGRIDVQIRNMWCNYNLPLHIDLRRVAYYTLNVEINKHTGILEMRKRNPACLAKISSSGKVNIIGCKSEADCMKASRQIARIIQRSMDRVKDTIRMRNYQVRNIMATCSVPFGIKIEEIARKYPNAQYEPEINTGLIWKSLEPKATLTIHTTGSITITGATSEAGVLQVVHNVYPALKEFSCDTRSRNLTLRSLPPHSMSRKRSNPPSSSQFSVKRSRAAPNCYGAASQVQFGGNPHFDDEDDLYDETQNTSDDDFIDV